MSLFPRFTQEFSPLFRLLDDYDGTTSRGFPAPSTQVRHFAPKFDVTEAQDAYELHGELPGIDQKDVAIEWTDGNTLAISGRVEQSREFGDRPTTAATAIEEDTESEKKQPQEQQDPSDEADAVTKPNQTPSSSQGAVARQDGGESAAAAAPKYWLSERSVGEFHRAFSFPARVDQDAVRASLKNGILSIVVPKAAAPKAKRINIE